jgi:hypothetical protein
MTAAAIFAAYLGAVIAGCAIAALIVVRGT